MKLTYIANACCIYEHEGFQILCDPWLTDGAFEGSWFHYPPLESKPKDFFEVDAIYISHLHPDHFDEKTLNEFPKSMPMIILDHGGNFLEKKLRALGFDQIKKVKDGEWCEAGPFRLTFYAPFAGHLFHETQLGNLIDSAMVVEAGGFKILNGNDNAPTLESAKKLHDVHGDFDLVQLVDSCAGPYPACFSRLSHEEKLKERRRILDRHLNLMMECAKVLGAKRMQPFAGHYQLGGRFVDLNQYLAVASPLIVADKIRIAELEPLLLYEKDSYSFEENEIQSYKDDRTFSLETWEHFVRDLPFSYDHLEAPTNFQLLKLCLQSHVRMLEKQKKWNCFPDWYCNINDLYQFRFDGSDIAGSHEKKIAFTMDPKLLGAILRGEIHFNNAEVGCHVDIDRDPNLYDPDIHTLLCFFHI